MLNVLEASPDCRPIAYDRGIVPHGVGYWRCSSVPSSHTWIRWCTHTVTIVSTTLSCSGNAVIFAQRRLDFDPIASNYYKRVLKLLSEPNIGLLVVDTKRYECARLPHHPFMSERVTR